jgi:hypothetical protein
VPAHAPSRRTVSRVPDQLALSLGAGGLSYRFVWTVSRTRAAYRCRFTASPAMARALLNELRNARVRAVSARDVALETECREALLTGGCARRRRLLSCRTEVHQHVPLIHARSIPRYSMATTLRLERGPRAAQAASVANESDRYASDPAFQTYISSVETDGHYYAVFCRVAFDGIEFVGRLWFAEPGCPAAGHPDRAVIAGRTRADVLARASELNADELGQRQRRVFAERRQYFPLRCATDEILAKVRYLNGVALSLQSGILDEAAARHEFEVTEGELHDCVDQFRQWAGVAGPCLFDADLPATPSVAWASLVGRQIPTSRLRLSKKERAKAEWVHHPTGGALGFFTASKWPEPDLVARVALLAEGIDACALPGNEAE